jgi:ATP-dependent Clp protease ATP-binding subunit ClpX
MDILEESERDENMALSTLDTDGIKLLKPAQIKRFLDEYVIGQEEAKKVLDAEFPELAASIQFRVPDEKFKRHGQAVIAASLPSLK